MSRILSPESSSCKTDESTLATWDLNKRKFILSQIKAIDTMGTIFASCVSFDSFFFDFFLSFFVVKEDGTGCTYGFRFNTLS
ncbi:Os05g0144150 [Oryza sativa Japonica Group]|uniref:Os05g0144150 protein n=1 Tax=Oryza sativa subsp. japonica TaxID=39947 RepID=C7J2T6_ORYSJ|nr:Os05g0144150 [Oryza sativa Japonica Group]|eukprot:NP_001174215.1 Os05g0144150 [Oryza sativa Japonica Group]